MLAKGGLKRTDQTNEAAQSYSVEAFNNLVAIRANCREDFESEKFRGFSFAHHKAMLSLAKILTFDKILSNYLSSLGPILILFLGGFFILNHSLAYETLVIFSVALGFLIAPINNMTLIPMRIRRVALATENMQSFLALSTEGAGRVSRKAIDVSAGDAGQPLINFKNVRFSYKKSNRVLALENVGIRRGSFTAVLSPSGYGKTTIMRLLFGLIEEYEGEIRIGGTDIRDVTLAEIRAHIAYLPQENYVFAGTVLDNLFYGARPGETQDEEKAVVALKKVRLYDEISKMPAGLKTNIEYMGRNLSGGQIRRLCLARVLMKDPAILILDEPFVGLHYEDQQIIINTLKAGLGDVTTLMITHQSEFAKYADKIVELSLSKKQPAGESEAASGTMEEVVALERSGV